MGNEGIVVKGSGQFRSKQTVVGKQAQIVNYGDQERNLLLERVNQLLSQIKEANIRPDQTDTLIEAANSIKEEAQKTVPDKSLIERPLSLIKDTAPAVTAIATARLKGMTAVPLKAADEGAPGPRSATGRFATVVLSLPCFVFRFLKRSQV